MDGYLGIDPGETGAAVLILGDSSVKYFDWPGDPSKAAYEIKKFLDIYDIRLALLEKVHSMPNQGVASTFKFGVNFGIWQGLLASFKIPYDFITPMTWQKGVFSKTDGDKKQRSLVVVKRKRPDLEEMFIRKKDHNRADAYLIAEYAKKIIKG